MDDFVFHDPTGRRARRANFGVGLLVSLAVPVIVRNSREQQSPQAGRPAQQLNVAAATQPLASALGQVQEFEGGGVGQGRGEVEVSPRAVLQYRS